MQLFSDQWLPWLALCLLLWLDSVSASATPRDVDVADTNRPRVRWRGLLQAQRWAILAAGFFCLHALTGAHNAVFGALMTATILLYFGVARRFWAVRDAWVGLLLIAMICAIVLVPLFYPYLILQERIHDQRIVSIEQLADGAARPLEFASAWSRFYLWVDGATGWPSAFLGCCPRTLLFPGAVPIVLAIIGLLSIDKKRRDHQQMWLLFLTLCFLLSLGPAFGLYRLVAVFPGTKLIRVPSRFMMPGNLALAMLAAFGAAAVARWVSRERGVSAALRKLHFVPSRSALVLGLLAVLFAVEAGYAPMTTYPFSPEPYPLYRWLGEYEEEFAIMEYPLSPDSPAIASRKTFYSIYHWKRLIVGYSGWRSEENEERQWRLQRMFPSDAALDELSELGVRFVPVYEDRVSEERLQSIAAQPRLVAVQRFGLIQVYELDR